MLLLLSGAVRVAIFDDVQQQQLIFPSAQELSAAEIGYFVNGAASGSIPKEQIGAMLMAIFLNGMSKNETGLFVYCC